MKSISIALACLLVCFFAAPNFAQNKKKAIKAKPVKPDNRTVSANPVIEGDPMIPEDRISIDDLKAKLAGGAEVLILDVRSASDWKASATRIKGAIRVPLEEVEKKMAGWKKTQEVIAYCACSDDATSLIVTATLKKAGFKNVKALWGGWHAWEQAGYATEAK
jgi:rhodanese-related sulfurtransferase